MPGGMGPFAQVTDILNDANGQKKPATTPEGDNIKYRRDVREGLKQPGVIPQPAAPASQLDAATVMAMIKKTLMERAMAAKNAGMQMLPTWMGGGPPPAQPPQQ